MFSENGSLKNIVGAGYTRHKCNFTWTSFFRTPHFMSVIINVCDSRNLAKYPSAWFRFIRMVNDITGEEFLTEIISTSYNVNYHDISFNVIMSVENLQRCTDNPDCYMLTCDDEQINKKEVFLEMHI